MTGPPDSHRCSEPYRGLAVGPHDRRAPFSGSQSGTDQMPRPDCSDDTQKGPKFKTLKCALFWRYNSRLVGCRASFLSGLSCDAAMRGVDGGSDGTREDPSG